MSVPSDAAHIAVVAADSLTRVKLAGALAVRPDLAVRAGASVGELINRGAAADALLVYYCTTIGSEDLSLFTELGRDFPELLIIAVCESADGRDARRAVDGGIDGLVFADQLESVLAPTVTAVLAGQMVVPRELRACVRKPSLSFRERQILGMLVMGCTNLEIGSRLYLAESTIKSHLSSAYGKLGVRSRSEAVSVIMAAQGSLGIGIVDLTSDPEPRAA